MKSFSALSLGSLALACSSFMACNEEEDLVPQMEPAKPAVQAAAPAPKAEVPAAPAAEAAAPAEEAKAADEPQLVPIQSLSASKDESAKEDAPAAKAPIANGDGQLDKGDYVIQVSIQASKKAADGIVKKLAEQNIKAYVAEVENPGELEGTYYRIRVGYFTTNNDAQEYGKQVLKALNFAWWVDKRKNDDVGNPAGDNESSYSSDMEEVEEAPAPAPAPAAEPAPAPAPAPAAEPAPAPAPAPAAEPAPAPAPAPAAEPAPAPAVPAAQGFDDWE